MTMPSSSAGLFATNFVENIMYRNLLLLGFNPCNEKHTINNVKFCASMFQRSNPKALLFVLHFLFHAKQPELTRQDFANVWPVLDWKQDKEFKEIALKKLVQLEKDGEIPRGTIRKSHLTTGFGPRLYNILWKFSDHVVRFVLSSQLGEDKQSQGYELPDAQSMSTSLLNSHQLSLQTVITLQEKDILREMKHNVSLSESLQKSINAFAKEYRQNGLNSQQIENEYTQFMASIDPDTLTDLARMKQDEHIVIQRKTMKKISDFSASIKDERDVVDYVMDDNISRVRVDGNALRAAIEGTPQKETVQLPAQLVSGDRVDLVELISKWNESMEILMQQMAGITLTQKLSEHDVSEPNVITLNDRLSLQRNQLSSVQRLCNDMRTLLPDIDKNVEILKDNIASEGKQSIEVSQTLTTSSSKAISPTSSMKLVPPTPDARTRSFTSAAGTPFLSARNSLAKSSFVQQTLAATLPVEKKSLEKDTPIRRTRITFSDAVISGE